MSLPTLTNVLRKIRPELAWSVCEEVLPSIRILSGKIFPGYSVEGSRKHLVSRLDEITNGSGVQIVEIAMWHEDCMNEYLETLAAEIVRNCAAIDREPINA